MRALPTGQTQRPDRAGGDKCGSLIAAADRSQLCDETNLLARGEIDGMCARLRAGTWRPCVADLSAEAPLTVRILDHQHRIDGLTQPRGRLTQPAAIQLARAGGQRHVRDDRHHQRRQQDDEGDLRARVRSRVAERRSARSSRLGRSGSLARHRHGRQYSVEHAVGVGAFQFGLRPKRDPMSQGRARHRLHVVGRDVVAARQPCP